MRHGRRLLQSVIVSLLTVMVLMNSGLLGPTPIGMASAHAIARAQAAALDAQVDKGRFVPNTQAPKLPVGTYHYPGTAKTYGSTSNTAAPSTIAASKRKPGEQVDMRTANSTTTLNPDGTWTLKTYGSQIHYKDAHGQWQDIDNTIGSDNSQPGYGLSNKANDWHVYFAPQSGTQNTVKVTYPNAGTVSATLDGAQKSSATAAGNKVTYPSVFSDVDLLYWLGHAHLEETLLLHSSNVPSTYRFVYHIPGVSARQDPQGNIHFLDAKGKEVMVIGDVSMYESDANGQMLGNGAGTSKVGVSLSGAGPDFIVTLTPDKAWLSDPKRRFPVSIDPSWSAADPWTNTPSGNITGDTFDESGNPTWSFYNTNSERIGNCNAIPSTATGYGTGTDRSYLKFPVGAPPVANLRVVSSYLQLYQTSSYSGNQKIIANAITGSWNETTLTWNNHPTGFIYGGVGYASTSYGVNIWLDMLPTMYAWWQAGLPINGFELQYADETQGCNLFASDDYGSNLPVLSVNYVTDSMSPSGSLSQVAPNGNTYNANGLTYTNSNTATLSPSFSDQGAATVWASHWTSVNGVSKLSTGSQFDAQQPEAWSVDSAGSVLNADTSTCGATACWAQTYFNAWIANTAAWPTFTAMFKTDNTNNFEFGVNSALNTGTRFMLHGSSGGFSSLMASSSAGSWSSYGTNIPISANTWYYGQVMFPLPNVGEIYVWPVGQAKPTSPTVYRTGVYIDYPGLVFQHNGDNGANLHHDTIGNVVIAAKDPGGADFGSPPMPGNDFVSGGTLSVQGAGADIWGTSDQFHYVWESLPGDGSLSAHVVNMANTDQWGKSGVMFRQGSGAGWQFYAVYATPGNGISVQYRAATSGNAAVQTSISGGAPIYLKITRSGTTYSAYTSGDGNTWTLIPNSPLSLPNLSGSILAGTAYTAHENIGEGWTNYDTIRLTGPATVPGCPSAWPCYDNGTGVWGMQFANEAGAFSCPWSGTWCIGSARQTNWAFSAGDGKKTVKAQFIDQVGHVSGAASNTTVIVDTTPPNASITSPASGRELRGVVTVSATASDPTASDGTNSGLIGGAAGVALFVDGAQMGSPVTSSSTPAFLWDTTNVAPGKHVLTVQATDAVGNSATSAGVTVDVSNGGQMPYETYAMRGLPSGDSAGVNVATGDAVVEHQDLDIPGRGPDLAIAREFDSLAPSNNLFGWGWTSDLDEHLTANSDGSVTYRDATGGYHIFLSNGSGGYQTSPGLYLTLVKNTDGTYTLTSHDQSKTNFNASGYLTSTSDRNGNTLTVAYTGTTPTTMTDAASRALTLTVTGGHITGIAAPGSRAYAYAYDANGNLTDYTDPGNVVTHYDYDGSHHITKITANYKSGVVGDSQTNVAATLGYDTANRLVSLVDPMNYDVGVTYSSPGSGQTVVKQLQTNSSTTPSTTNSVYESTTYQQTTDGSGAIAQITNPIGTVTAYTYDSADKLTSVVADSGDSTHLNQTTSWTYDSNGNELTQVVDPGTGHLALTTTWTYDLSNNVLTEADPLGYITQYTYDTPATGNLTKVVKDYVSGGLIDQQTNVTTTYTYDVFGEALTSTDPLGIVTQYAYDTQGDRLTTSQNYKSGVAADSQTNVQTSATYDALGQTLTSTDALGIVTQTTYDIRGNAMQTVANYKSGVAGDSQTNVTSSATYDALGRKATETNPRNIVTQHTYDNDGRETQTTRNYKSGVAADSQTNVATTTSYDGAGNATVATDAKGNTTTTTYDLDNRATEVVQNASPAAGGRQISDKKTVYDAVGRTKQTQVVDSNTNPITSYTYDAAGRKATQSDPPAKPGATDQSGQPNVTTYTYDVDGNVTETKVTNSLASPTTVSDTKAAFDKVNSQISKTEEASSTNPQTTTYVHDANGRQTSFTDPSNKTTTSTYDALGRTLTVTDASNSVTTSTYDAAGRRLTQSNSAGTTTDNYDALGRVSSEQRTDGANVIQTITTSTYDVNGNLTQKSTTNTNSQVTTLTYSYDALDRQATMSDGTRSYAYDANGNMTQMQVFNGTNSAIKFSSGYDGGNRLTTLADTAGPGNSALHTYSYGYDGSGNRNSVTEDSTTTTYVYDGDNQLTQVQNGTTVTETYTYDASHNRTSLVTSAGTTSYSYNSTNALTQKTDPNGKVTQYSYDTTNGNLTSATYDPTPGVNQVTSYSYDATQRLKQVTKPDGSTVAFAYDADGNRLSKTTTSGTTTTMVKDTYQSGQLVSESDGSGTLLATFTYDVNGVPSSVQVGSDLTTAPRYYYSYNGHGDVVALTDAGGTTVATYSYDTFGTPTSWESFSTGWHNPFRYDGRDGARYDGETGLYWLSVRAYDPTLGRFLSRDPLGRAPLFFDASQPYAYGGNNPVNNVDPSGQRFTRQMMDGGDWMPHRVAKSATRRVQTARSRRVAGQHRQLLVASTAGAPGLPGYACNNVCVAKRLAEQASFVFGAISVGTSIVLGALAAYLTLVTGGWGIFFGGMALGAAAPIVFASWGASYWFGAFDNGAAGDPAYFATWHQNIVNVIGLTSVLVLAMGALMSFIFGKSVGALMNAGKAVAKLLTVQGAGLFLAGLSAGLVVGALATLLILAPLSEWYIQRMKTLLYGSEKQCGNYDYGADVLCPAV